MDFKGCFHKFNIFLCAARLATTLAKEGTLGVLLEQLLPETIITEEAADALLISGIMPSTIKKRGQSDIGRTSIPPWYYHILMPPLSCYIKRFYPK